jgi:hypothetical protein
VGRPESDIDFSPLCGQKVVEINRMYPILVFEEGSLMIECPWRLRKGNRILVGRSEFLDESRREKACEELESHLVGKKIAEIVHNADISDLTVHSERI